MRQLVHLVEDDPVVWSMLARLLNSGGYSVMQKRFGRSELLSVLGQLAIEKRGA